MEVGIADITEEVSMTSDHVSRDWAKHKIQSAGLRATPARIATLVVLKESSSCLSHAEACQVLNDHDIDRATVFRNLNDMVAVNILRRTQFGDHVWRFEIISDDAHRDREHPRFMCVDCGSVSSIGELELTLSSEVSSQRYGEITEILLRGHCTQCS